MKAFFDYVMSSLALSLMYTIYMDRIWKFPCVLVDGNVATHTHTSVHIQCVRYFVYWYSIETSRSCAERSVEQ